MKTRIVTLALAATALVAVPASAFATTGGLEMPDFTEGVNTFVETVADFVSTNAPALFIALAVMGGIGWVWKKLRSAMSRA